MKVLILGGDGYLGWPTSMHFAGSGHEVVAADNYLRRTISVQTSSEPLVAVPNLVDRAQTYREVSGNDILVELGDLCDYRFMERLFLEYQPDVCIHYAEQPSAPYSMKGFEEAELTFRNNLSVTFNLIWAVKEHKPDCHIIKLGTMGEYGTPNIDIEEGWLDIKHKGREERFLYPRQAASLYHTTKIHDTDLLWFYVRTHGLKVTDLMQGPVYGVHSYDSEGDDRLITIFNYDDLFGTVVNRFLVQAAIGMPLTVYGKGGQTRGYLNLKDTIQCVDLAASSDVEGGELRIFNQFTEAFSVLELAEKMQEAGKLLGVDVQVQSIENPRKESENHYYNPSHSGLLDLGLKPHYMTPDTLAEMLKWVIANKSFIDEKKIMPRVKWA